MVKLGLAMVMVLSACSGDDGGVRGVGDDTDGPADAPKGPTLQYQSFMGKTRSLSANSEPRLYSITDTQGAIACGLSNDFSAQLGTQGNEIIIALDGFIGGVCPVGTHTIQAPANCAVPEIGGPPSKCAYYRRVDASANLLGTLVASAGAVTFSGNETACTVTVNLSFSGQAFTDTVTLTNGLVANPWCK